MRTIVLTTILCLVVGCGTKERQPTDIETPLNDSLSNRTIQLAGKSSSGVVETESQDASAPVTELINAITRQDWDGLREMTKKLPRGSEYIEKWKKNPIKIGELKSIQHDVEFDATSCVSYSYQMKYKDGTLHPHWLVIFVGEDNTQSKLLGFYEFGW